jgi:hypothetical protein
MKKLILFLVLSLVAGAAIASPYWLPRQYFGGDQIISTTKVVITDISIYWKGVTVGDGIYLRNGKAVDSVAFFTFFAPTANGFVYVPPRKDIVADQGLYFDSMIRTGCIGISINYQ